MAIRGDVTDPEGIEYNDTVYDKWWMILLFGLVVWASMVLASMLSMLSGFYWWVGLVNAATQCCCIQVPMIVQTVLFGVYRYEWYGATCSQEGAAFEEHGKWMHQVFIGQIVCNFLFFYCTQCSTR